MRPKFYDKSISGPDDTIKQVFDDLDYCPTWFFLDDTIEIIIDIGAMIGSFTLWAHEKWPDAIIYSYEPDPKSFAFLKKNISTCTNLKNINFFNFAVWSDESEVLFQQFEKTPSCNSMIIFDPPYALGTSTKIKIKTESISKIIKKFDKIDFLKIDCEGSEYGILYSLKKNELQKIKYIALEYHEFETNKKYTANKLSNFLRKNGFLTQIVPNTNKKYAFGYIYAAKIKSDPNIINKIFDGETKRILKSIELPVILQGKFIKLQNEFYERTEWALNLDKESKEKDNAITHFQNMSSANELKLKETQETLSANELKLKETQETLSANELKLKETQETLSANELKLKETQETLSIKDVQLQELREYSYSKQNELDAINHSILFKIPFKIAREIDKIFPEFTKRGEMIRLLRMALLIAQNEGFRVLLQSFNEKLKRRHFLKKKSISKLKQSNIVNRQNENNNKILIHGNENNDPDLILRNFIHPEFSNILHLSKFPKISIIIPTFNQLSFLKKNLETIEKKTTYKNYEIIIVTNNLDENSEMRKFLKSIKHQVCIFTDEYSFSNVNNYAAKKAKGEYLLFLNDDVEIISPNWLESMLKLILYNTVGAVGAKLLFSNRKLQEAGGIVWKNGIIWNYGRNENPQDPRFNFVRSVDYCSGSCLLIKKDLFEKVGKFDTQYRPAYCEDTDICLTLQKAGLKILYQPLATMIHHEGKTSGIDLTSGIKSYQIQNQKKFRNKWNSFLDSRLNASSDNAFLERNRKDGINILYIDHYIPEYNKDAGSLLVYQVLSILSYLNHKVTFWPDNLARLEPYATSLQQKGIEIVYGNNSFESYIKKHGNNFQICILTRAHIAPKYIDLIRQNAPNCKIIYDTVDLHFVREYREAKLKNDTKKIQQSKLTKTTEFDLFDKSDIVVVKSKEDADILLSEKPTLPLAIIPTFNIPSAKTLPFEKRQDLLFLGGFQHVPNIDSLEYLITNLFPKIRSNIPNVFLNVIGSNPTKHVIDLCSNEKNVNFLGYMPEIESYLQNCKLLIAPIRYGSGVKGKITQSMANGLVVVTTPLGSEGISNSNDILKISHTDDEFVENVIQMYNNEQEWTKISQNAKIYAEKYFSPETVKNTLEQIITFCMKN